MNAFRVTVVRQLAGVSLFGLTLAAESLLGGFVRWLAAWPTLTVAGLFLTLPFDVETGAWAVALAPVAWSASAIVIPSRGVVWRRRLGGRRPTADEQLAYEDSLALLRATAPHLSAPRTWFVLDDAQPRSAVIGRTLMVTRGVFELDALVPVMAHELGHIASTDGLLTEALNRLAFWGDPWSVVQRLFSWPWSTYWRYREYDADAYAAALGCADDLAQHLHDEHLILDTPIPHLLFNPALHPPVALRIDRLRKAADRVVWPSDEEDEVPPPPPAPVEPDPVPVDQTEPVVEFEPPIAAFEPPSIVETLKTDLDRRREELRPLVEEARRLEKELALLKSMQRAGR